MVESVWCAEKEITEMRKREHYNSVTFNTAHKGFEYFVFAKRNRKTLVF